MVTLFRLLLLLALSVVVWPVAAEATPTRLTQCEGVDTTATDTTFSCGAMTVNTGSRRVMWCGVGNNDTVDVNYTVVWHADSGDQSLTQIVEGNTSRYLSVFRLIAPNDGTSKTVEITAGGSAAARDGIQCAVYSDVDQGTPNDAIQADAGAALPNPWSSTSITSPAGDSILSFVFFSNLSGTAVTGGGNTLINDQTVGSGKISAAEDLDGADDTIDWSTGSGPTGRMYTFNVNFDGGAGGGGGGTGGLLLLGVGK